MHINSVFRTVIGAAAAFSCLLMMSAGALIANAESAPGTMRQQSQQSDDGIADIVPTSRPSISTVPLNQTDTVDATEDNGSVRGYAERPEEQTLSASIPLAGKSGLSSVAVTWNQSDEEVQNTPPTIQMRYQDDGVWSEWEDVTPNIASEERDTASAPTLQATDSAYVGTATAAEVRVAIADGVSASNVELKAIDSGYSVAQEEPGDQAESGITPYSSDMDGDSSSDPNSNDSGTDSEIDDTDPSYDPNYPVGTNHIQTREDWWRSDLPAMTWRVDNSGDWRGAIVHHTVDRNDYSRAEVKAIVQNIYIFHNQVRHWGDIGYNLLVDRFGGVWEGRDEGVPNTVVPDSNAIGAQTSFFNEHTFGVAVIGSFHQDDKPSEIAIQSVAQAIAWEFKAMGITDANGTFPYLGTQQRIAGHGDASHHHLSTNETLCPGKHLSEQLPHIRTVVNEILKSGTPKGAVPVYRVYNPNSGLHHYTTNDTERELLVSIGWNDEHIAFYASTAGQNVYRLYNPNDGNHLWTMNRAEYNHLASIGWNPEKTAWQVPSSGGIPVYRLYNPNSGEHLYTTNGNEYASLPVHGWKQENVAWNSL